MATVFGARVRQLREQMGMTQEELALILGTDQNQMSKYERGKNEPSASVLIRFSEVLNTSSDFLLGLSDVSAPPLRFSAELSADERHMVELYRSASPSQRKIILRAVTGMIMETN